MSHNLKILVLFYLPRLKSHSDTYFCSHQFFIVLAEFREEGNPTCQGNVSLFGEKKLPWREGKNCDGAKVNLRISSSAGTKKWLILEVSLTHLAES